MTKKMKIGVALMFLSLYSRSFSEPLLDGWWACGSMAVGVFLWTLSMGD